MGQNACWWWSRSRSNSSLKIIKFLAEAGADFDYQPGAACVCALLLQWHLNLTSVCSASAKTMLFLASLATLIENPAQSYAHSIQSHPISINICRSVFGMDLASIVLDILDGRCHAHKLQAALGFNCSAGGCWCIKSLWRQLTGVTRLEYAIYYIGQQCALQLLEQSEDASWGAPLVAAVLRGYDGLLRPLLDAGADINAHAQGFSTLHRVCYLARLDTLKALIELAGDKIDWHARTTDNKSMDTLELVKESPWWSSRPALWRTEMLIILREHGLKDDDRGDGSVRMPGGWN